MHRTLLPLLTLLPLSHLPAQDQPAPTGDKLQLQVHPNKGPATWFKNRILSAQSIDLGAQQMEIKADVVWVLNATVVEVPADGLPVVAFEIAAVRGELSLPKLGEVKFDSTDAAEGDDIAAGMSAMVGTRFKATVSANGKVTITDDLEPKLEAAREKAGGMASQMLMSVLNPGTIQHLADGVFGNLPEKAVAVGDSWEHGDKPSAGRAPVASKTRLTLAKVTGDLAEITATGTVEITPGTEAEGELGEGDEAAMARELMKNMKVENGKLSGKLVWSRKDCMVVSSDQDMSMDISMPGPMGGEMKIRQTQKMQVERTTADAAKAKAKAAAPVDKQ